MGCFGLPIDADATHVVGRQPLGEFPPTLAGISRLVKTAARSPFANRIVTIHPIRFWHGAWPAIETIALTIPECGDDIVRVGWVHYHVDDPGLVVNEQDLFPSLAAVGRLKHTAIFIRAIESSGGSDINNFWILWGNKDATDLVSLLEPHVLPSGSAIGRFIDSISVRNRVARIRFACSRPYDLCVRWIDCNRT